MTTFWSLVLISVVSIAFYWMGYRDGSKRYNMELENSHTLLNVENEILMSELEEMSSKVKEREADE